MCAIAGIWNLYNQEDETRDAIRSMIGMMRHRGPENEGFAVAPHVALGHARLSIVDVSGGNQPLFNEDGRLGIVGNNEIYNAPALRRELEAKGHRFRSHSDTEVVLHGYEEWREDVFAKLNGMFAVAIWDKNRNSLTFARDPLGIKPLHYTEVGRGVAFASEIKGLLVLPEVRREVNWDAVHLFMNFRYVPDDRTLFRGIHRVPPGSWVRLDAEGVSAKTYFDLGQIAAQPTDFASAKRTLSSLIPEAVTRHLISDVEVAAYLSGGIDSSLVSYHAAKASKGIKTFCLGFNEPTDENSDAEKVAQAIGSTHQSLFLSAEPLDRFESILWHLEEPKVNAMQGFHLAEAVSKEVKVALSGLGGDELFAGYVNNDILYPMTLMSRYFKMRTTVSASAISGWVSSPRTDHYVRAGELGLNAFNPLSFYCILRNCFDHNRNLMHALYNDPPPHWHNLSRDALRPFFNARNPDTLNEILRLEARTKLVNDFLLTEDRVSMAHSLEVRVPLLDKELVQFAFSLPSTHKYRLGDKKRILKAVAREWLDPAVLSKKKWGFSVNPVLLYEKQLRHYAREVLTEKRVRELGLFSWSWIEKVLNAPVSPRMRWHYFNLWVMTGITQWHEMFFGNESLGKFNTKRS